MSIDIKPSHKGLLHKDLGIKQSAPIPAKKLAKAARSSSPAERKRAVFAENARHWDHSKRPKPVKTDRGEFGMK